jgi:hypothetical protein
MHLAAYFGPADLRIGQHQFECGKRRRKLRDASRTGDRRAGPGADCIFANRHAHVLDAPM